MSSVTGDMRQIGILVLLITHLDYQDWDIKSLNKENHVQTIMKFKSWNIK